MKFLMPIGIAALFIFLLFAIFGYVCFVYSFVRRRRDGQNVNAPINKARYKGHESMIDTALEHFDKLEKEEVSITSFDGLKLFATYIPSKEPQGKLVIAFHGYRSSAIIDFAPVIKGLLDSGASLLLVDVRCHRRSDGRYIGFGALEHRDVCDWCDYAKKRFGDKTRIYLYGVSMGATSVMMASSKVSPKTVRGIVADCGFTSPIEIMTHVLRREKKIPPYPTVYFLSFFVKLIAGYDPKKYSAVESVKKSDIPLLLIHGAEDRYVPTEMSKRIYDARPENSKLVIVAGARHARSSIANEKLYTDELLGFIEKN